MSLNLIVVGLVCFFSFFFSLFLKKPEQDLFETGLHYQNVLIG